MKNIDEELDKLNNVMIKYVSALKVLETQLQIINDDFKYIKKYNPIEHIKTRIKSADSIMKKLYNDHLSFTLENVISYVNDIVGVRIICASLDDVYELLNILRNSKVIKIINEKDFISHPKKSGYRSFHLIVLVPVELINGQELVRAEIQIRTLAMDLWASLEHKLKYKSDYCTEDISKRLITIGDELSNIDNEMNDLIMAENEMKLLDKGEI